MADRPGGSGPTREQQPSRLYTLIMTPINFVTFLVSLLVIELRYSMRRAHTHAEKPSRLPAWLHHLLYHPHPYQGVRAGEKQPPEGAWFYHSKQKKLMKMEAEEAFAMRKTVLVLLALLSLVAMGGAWALFGWTYRRMLLPLVR